MSYQIVSIDFPLRGATNFSTMSHGSALDADIVIFNPRPEYDTPLDHEDEPKFLDYNEHKILSYMNHWCDQINSALSGGTTVFVMASSFTRCWLPHKGKQGYILPHSNLGFIQQLTYLKCKKVAGNQVRFLGHSVFSEFITRFQTFFKYFFTFECSSVMTPILCSRNDPNRCIAAFQGSGSGHIVLLPWIDVQSLQTSLLGQSVNNESEALIVAENMLLQSLIKIHIGLSADVSKISVPEWSEEQKYRVRAANSLSTKQADLDIKIARAYSERSKVGAEIEELNKYKLLLYGVSTPLEEVITLTLRLLGYKVSHYRQDHIEIDHIILDPLTKERFICETEGADRRAINIEKFRQLQDNINADLAKGSKKLPASGILFGNGKRLLRPENRGETFTIACRNRAAQTHCILVQTPDLYPLVQYLLTNDDGEFKAQARQCISESKGSIVQFPKPPAFV